MLFFLSFLINKFPGYFSVYVLPKNGGQVGVMIFYILLCSTLIHKYPPPSLPWSMPGARCLENRDLYRFKTALPHLSRHPPGVPGTQSWPLLPVSLCPASRGGEGTSPLWKTGPWCYIGQKSYVNQKPLAAPFARPSGPSEEIAQEAAGRPRAQAQREARCSATRG